METEMVTSDGKYNIGFSTGEDALGNGDTEPVLEISRRTAVDAEKGWQYEWEHVGLFTADQVIDVLRRVEALPF